MNALTVWATSAATVTLFGYVTQQARPLAIMFIVALILPSEAFVDGR